VDTVKLKAELEKTKEENAKLRKELEQYRKEVYMDRFSLKTSIKKMEIEQVIDIYAHFLYLLKEIKSI